MGNDVLGYFGAVVLTAVKDLDQNAYGVPIRQKVEQLTGKATAYGAIYTTLTRLEKKGLVKSFMGEPTAERGGKARRYFQVTGEGFEALKKSQGAFLTLGQQLGFGGK